jgi:hypothetical protein
MIGILLAHMAKSTFCLKSQDVCVLPLLASNSLHPGTLALERNLLVRFETVYYASFEAEPPWVLKRRLFD